MPLSVDVRRLVAHRVSDEARFGISVVQGAVGPRLLHCLDLAHELVVEGEVGIACRAGLALHDDAVALVELVNALRLRRRDEVLRRLDARARGLEHAQLLVAVRQIDDPQNVVGQCGDGLRRLVVVLRRAELVRARLGDGAAKPPSVDPRIVGEPDLETLVRDVPVDAVGRDRERSLLVRSLRFRRPDLIGLAQQDGRADDALAEVEVEDRQPEIAGNGAGNAVGHFRRLAGEELQLRRFQI